MVLRSDIMKYLKKYVKFREENGYVLICDCSIIQNYELPLDTLKLLEQLKKGYDPSKPVGLDIEVDLIDDLENLGLIDDVPHSNSGFHEQQWISLGYDENEFFQ